MLSIGKCIMFKCEVCGSIYHQYEDVIVCEKEHYKKQNQFLRQCYDQAEKEIEKLHDINWKLEKELMERRGFELNKERGLWKKFISSHGLTVSCINIPVGKIQND